jgi:hypothetical protein
LFLDIFLNERIDLIMAFEDTFPELALVSLLEVDVQDVVFDHP